MRVAITPLISLLTVVLVSLPIFIAYGTSPVKAGSAKSIPIKAAVLIDEGEHVTGSDGELFQSTKRVLDVNKIPFDILDVSQIDNYTFVDSSLYLRYSVLLVVSPGWRIDSTNSKLIIGAVEKGLGVVGLMTNSVNGDLMPLFGIDEMGTQWHGSEDVQIIKDKFTFSYEGQTIIEDFTHLDHHLLPNVEVVANFSDSGDPALWTYKYGAGKTVFHNHTAIWITLYEGILLQSILYAMPIGVACPINAGVIEVDDCPRSFYSNGELQNWHYNFYYNFKEWLQAYNLTASFFIAFAYSGNINDFWVHPESLECANDIIKSGYELGLHCGNKHIPLNVAYWGSKAAIDTEVDEMMQALGLLQDRLYSEYGTQLGKVVSYIAPMNAIGDYGYESLDTRTHIRYVGTGYVGFLGGYIGTESLPYSGGYAADYLLEYPLTLKKFGWERDLDIYNLPRTQGNFQGFNQTQDDDYSMCWNQLRSVIESGSSYLIFTHPDERELLDKDRFPNASMPNIFEGYRVWGDYVSSYYPFYRWWTASELGQYLEKREGVLDATWLPEDSTLKLQLSQPDDVIHIKTREYLKSISQVDETISLAFSSSPADFKSDKYDVVYVGQDYFIYLKDSKSSRPVIPETPFMFEPIPVPATEPPNTGDEDALPLPIPSTEPQNTGGEDTLSLSTLVSIIASTAFFLGGLWLLRIVSKK